MFIAFHITVGLFTITKEMHHDFGRHSISKAAGGDVIELTVIWRGDLDCKGVLALLW